jgi:hypothetical protein
MALFLLPTVMSSAVVALFGSHLGLCGHQAPEELAYTFTYLSVFSGSLLVFFGEPPAAFDYVAILMNISKPESPSPISFGTT